MKDLKGSAREFVENRPSDTALIICYNAGVHLAFRKRMAG
jgi:hypothetical protein